MNNKKGDKKSGMGKQGTNSVNQSEHPVVVDESSLSVVHTPGKNGGTFQLPLGAKLRVPDACLGKRDTVSCQVAGPNTRWLTCPHHLPSCEHVNSEIFTLRSSARSLKKHVVVLLPFRPVRHEFEEINVKGKWTDEAEWVNIGFLIKELDEAPCVELDVDRLGTFLVTSTPKTETFAVGKQGCLYQARLSKHLSVRFPKKSIDQDIECALQIHPVSPEKIKLARDLCPQETAELVAVTEFTDVIATAQCTFRHPVTVKLPLPVGMEVTVEGGGAAATSEGHQDIAVLYKSNFGWELVETNYKFTRTTVTFDIRELTRYCVVQCVPGRQKKMKDAVTAVEGRHNKERGEVCLFLSMKRKSWFALVEVVPDRLLDTKISDRKAQGFTYLPKKQTPVPANQPARFSNRRMPPSRKNPVAQREDSLELCDGSTWLVDVDGDVKVSVTSDLRENNQLRYFSRLGESFRTFYFEPLDDDPRTLDIVINLIPVGVRDEQLRNRMTFSFEMEIETSLVVEYLVQESVPEEKKPEPKKEVTFELEPEVPKEEVVLPPPPSPKYREIPANVMKRLTQTSRPIRVQTPRVPIYQRPLPTRSIPADRESRALSGKSLMTLARIVPEGLTLAVHLQLPDSTITGIGFDALSNSLNMSDVSYKILLHWKRKCKDKQTGAITQLTDALKEMNYPDIAAAVLDCHNHNKEFTPDCVSHFDLYGRVAAMT